MFANRPGFRVCTHASVKRNFNLLLVCKQLEKMSLMWRHPTWAFLAWCIFALGPFPHAAAQETRVACAAGGRGVHPRSPSALRGRADQDAGHGRGRCRWTRSRFLHQQDDVWGEMLICKGEGDAHLRGETLFVWRHRMCGETLVCGGGACVPLPSLEPT